MTPKTSIEVRSLTRKFGDFIAVDDISFSVEKGEIFGFLGANGAGKTTAIRMLCGLLSPTSGKAEVAGYDVSRDPERVKQHIGYMSQKFSLYPSLTGRENLTFYAGIYGLNRKTIKSKIEVLSEVLRTEGILDVPVRQLPLGWRQKIAFSSAIMHDPEIVFLDEPTGGVDPITRRQFWEMIYQSSNKGISVFVTTHYMDEAEYCDRISIMVDGRIEALDTPENLKTSYSSSSIDEVFLQLARQKRIKHP